MKSARWLTLACLIVAGIALPMARPGVARADEAHLGPLAAVAGQVQSCPAGGRLGTWVVDGQAVQVAGWTIFVEGAGPAAVGAQVMVVARVGNGGELQALVVRTQTQTQARRAQALIAQLQRASQAVLRLRQQAFARLRTQDQVCSQEQLQVQQQMRTQAQTRLEEQTQAQLQLRDESRTQEQVRIQSQQQTRTRAMQGR